MRKGGLGRDEKGLRKRERVIGVRGRGGGGIEEGGWWHS